MSCGPHPAVAAVRAAVRADLAQLAQSDPRALVLAACSGGADSVALALALAFVAPRLGLRAGALIVDHGLQDGSAPRSAALAADLRNALLDPVEVLTVQVGTGSGGPEAAARAARYGALEAAAVRLGAAAVLLGHTRDDQSETVLLGLARGSGTRSLSGMAARRGVFRRPLLDLERTVPATACAALGVGVWADPHNADPRFTRSRVRSRVLPLLEEQLGPGIAAALARTAALARADADALDDLAAELAAATARGAGRWDGRLLAAAPAALRHRVLHRAARAAGCPGTDLSAHHVTVLDALVTAWHGQGPIDLPGGVRAGRDGAGLLWFGRPGQSTAAVPAAHADVARSAPVGPPIRPTRPDPPDPLDPR